METIKQLREVECRKLVKRLHPGDATEEEMREAWRIMRSYYRLYYLSKRNMFGRGTEASEEQERKWFARLDKTLRENYRLELVYIADLPSIGFHYGENNEGYYEYIWKWFYE